MRGSKRFQHRLLNISVHVPVSADMQIYNWREGWIRQQTQENTMKDSKTTDKNDQARNTSPCQVKRTQQNKNTQAAQN